MYYYFFLLLLRAGKVLFLQNSSFSCNDMTVLFNCMPFTMKKFSSHVSDVSVMMIKNSLYTYLTIWKYSFLYTETKRINANQLASLYYITPLRHRLAYLSRHPCNLLSYLRKEIDSYAPVRLEIIFIGLS